MTFSRLLGLGTKDEACTPIHVENKLKPSEVSYMFFNPILAREGKAINLLPHYNLLNNIFHETIDPKGGDATSFNYYALNLLNRMARGGAPFCIFDYIWNELRRAMNDSRKGLPYAPYIMYMIERVSKKTFCKDHAHLPFHPRV